MKKNQTKEDVSIASQAREKNTGKEDLPSKNPVTNDAKNAASQSLGLNQEKTTRDDLLPSDGDNLTQ